VDVPTDTNYCTLFPTTGGPGGGRLPATGCHPAWCRCVLQNEGASWKTTRAAQWPRGSFLQDSAPPCFLTPVGFATSQRRSWKEACDAAPPGRPAESPASWHFRVDPLGPEAAVVKPGTAQTAASWVLSTQTHAHSEGQSTLFTFTVGLENFPNPKTLRQHHHQNNHT